MKLATVGAGEVFGEYSFFDGHPESAGPFCDAMIRVLIDILRTKKVELDDITVG